MPRIAIAFDLQVLPQELPVGSFDLGVDVIVTETETIALRYQRRRAPDLADLNRGSAVRYNEPMARETAFHPITSKKAAGFSDEAGWLWVTNFGDPAAEYRAIREGWGCGICPRSTNGSSPGKTPSRPRSACTPPTSCGMTAGQVRYGPFVDEDGLLVDDGTVFRFAEDHLWVCTNSDEREEYFGAASKGLDVQVRYIAPELPSMQIQGPKSRELMRFDHGCGSRRAPLLPFPPGAGAGRWRAGVALPDGVQRRAGVRGLPPSGARRDPLGGGRKRRRDTRTAPDAIEPIRVEVGMIVTDYDYEPHQRTPFDLGLDRFVSLNELNMGTEKPARWPRPRPTGS